ncbi:MAG: hypothetical protein KIS62_18560 [Ramlibacter sp.]|nr:hypothetical protein [Ramlibacter sp.]
MSILYIGWRGEKTRTPVAIFNHTTRQLFVHSPERLVISMDLPGDTLLGCLMAFISLGGLVVWPVIFNSIYEHKKKGEQAGWIGFAIGAAIVVAQIAYNSWWKQRRLSCLRNGVANAVLKEFEFGAEVPTDVALTTLQPVH